MKAPAIPDNERQRLATLRSLAVLGSSPDDRFDRLTRLAKHVFGVEIALVTLVDEHRQWFKSKQGLEVDETPRDVSFCGHAILGDDAFVVPNALEDPRFDDNPLVAGNPHIRFYAGCPLRAADGHRLGTLCVIDPKPREFSKEHQVVLRDLADLVEYEINLRDTTLADELTGLLNRRGFILLAGKVFAMSKRLGGSVLMHYFHLRTASIVDGLGSEASDRALWEFAEYLGEVVRESDVVGRVDENEFCAMLTGINAGDETLLRLRARIDARNSDPLEPFLLEYTTSTTPYDAERHDALADLMSEADGMTSN